MKTIKKQKASRRNFMLMSIVGMITVLEQFERFYTKSYIYKGYLKDAICTLEHLYQAIVHTKDSNPEYLEEFYPNDFESVLERF